MSPESTENNIWRPSVGDEEDEYTYNANAFCLLLMSIFTSYQALNLLRSIATDSYISTLFSIGIWVNYAIDSC